MNTTTLQQTETLTAPKYKAVKNLLSKGTTNAKTIKNDLETFIFYMAPSDLSGFNVCAFASKGCIKACLNTAGRGVFNNVQLARINKTKFWGFNREGFYIQLANEILRILDKTIKKNIKIAIRLNGTSDINHLDLLKRYSGIDFLDPFYSSLLFYDYTPNSNYINKYKNSNYKLTFSRKENNENKCIEVLNNGGNVAVVFRNELPQYWNGFKVINGDDTDLRYFDPSNVVVGLKAKGKAKKDLSGFVVG
jgi:flavodoxin